MNDRSFFLLKYEYMAQKQYKKLKIRRVASRLNGRLSPGWMDAFPFFFSFIIIIISSPVYLFWVWSSTKARASTP